MVLAIIKYGMGNAASVEKALNKLGHSCIITDDHSKVREADVIVLPGVGSFKKGMQNLINSGLAEVLTQEVILNKKPFIGICLGMQLTAKYGNEPEKIAGLGWVDGEVKKIESTAGLRVPHLGWNTLKAQGRTDLYSEFNGEDCYFIHSYHFELPNLADAVFTTYYGGEIVAAFKKHNIFGMQFHPEKSQEVGMKLLKKILEEYA